MADFDTSIRLWHLVRKSVQFVCLLRVRAASQFSDGLFQSGLAGALLFNPDRAAGPWAIAGAFGVLFLPYSLLGPFAGALLDRWNRRRVLIVANCARLVLVGVIAIQLASDTNGVAILCAALLANGLTRFVSAGLAAALPDVVEESHVVTMNSVAVAVGAISVFLGMNTMLILRHLMGVNDQGASWIIASVGIPLCIAVIVSWRFAPWALGPKHVHRSSHSVFYTVMTGLRYGIKAIVTHRDVAANFVGLIIHRMTIGINTLLLLILVHHGDDHAVGGLGTTALFIAAAGIGSFCATLSTPPIVGRYGRWQSVNYALGFSIFLQSIMASLYYPALMVCSFLLGFSGQIIKLCTDTVIQIDIRDELRGHVFAVQDSLFWIVFVMMMMGTAALLPTQGYSSAPIYLGSVLYVVGFLAHFFLGKPTSSLSTLK